MLHGAMFNAEFAEVTESPGGFETGRIGLFAWFITQGHVGKAANCKEVGWT